MFPYVLTSLTECQGKKWGRSSGKIPGKSIKKTRLAHHFCSACFWDPNEHSWKHGSHISQFIQKGRFYWETFVYRNYIRIHFKPQQLLIILAGITRRFGTSKCWVDSGTITLNKHNRGGRRGGGPFKPLVRSPGHSRITRLFLSDTGWFMFTHHNEIYTIQWFTFCIYLCIITYLLFFFFDNVNFNLQHLVRERWEGVREKW